MKYKIPDGTHIGHVHLKVSDLNKSLTFYQDILGFEITQWYGDSAVFLSAGGYHHHIGFLEACAQKVGASGFPLYRTTFIIFIEA